MPAWKPAVPHTLTVWVSATIVQATNPHLWLPMPARSKDRIYGTLEALVLKTLAVGPRHGYGIARWIEESTSGVIQVEEGSLYPALYRMEKRGWIQAEWSVSELNRRVKVYRLTPDGRRQLRAETTEWERFATAVSGILLAT